MSLIKPWKQVEGGFFRRTLQSTTTNDASSIFTYHHHILMGCTLWMIKMTMEPTQTSEFKYSKVQGTRKGRLQGLMLTTESEVRGSTSDEQLDGIFNRRTKYMIHITGESLRDHKKATWQLVTLSKAVYDEWMERLYSATSFLTQLEDSGESEQLLQLALKLISSLRPRAHWYKFVAYADSFCGYRAVAAIAKYCHCNTANACTVGNKLVAMGLIEEVRGVHLLGNDYRLYTFGVDENSRHRDGKALALPKADSEEEVKDATFQEAITTSQDVVADETISSASETRSPTHLLPPVPPLASLPSVWTVLTMTGVGAWVLGVVLWVSTPRGKGFLWGELSGEIFIAVTFFVLLYMMQVNNTMVAMQQKRLRADKKPTNAAISTAGQPSGPDHILRTPTPWPHDPLLITRSPLCLPSNISSEECSALLRPITLPESAVVSFRTDYFEGKIKMLFRHTKPEHFRGKKRYFEYVVQGRFTKEVAFQSVFTGQSCPSPLPYQPSRWLISALHAFQPNVLICAEGDRPYFLSPLMSTMQRVAISLPGSEPDIEQEELEDDLRVLDNDHLNTLTPFQRRRYFKQPGNLEKYSFKPAYVYTFSAYEHLFSFQSYQAELGFFTYDITRILGKMPMQIMGLIWDPAPQPHTSNSFLSGPTVYSPAQWQYIYCFDVYHAKQREMLLREEEREIPAEQDTILMT